MTRRLSGRRFLGIALVLFMFSLSLACGGWGEVDTQEPVNDAKSRYEDWLLQIGAMPKDVIGPPLIMEPAQDDSVSDTITVKGWSVTAADIGAATDAPTYVRLYAAPADDREALSAREVTRVEVDPENGEWQASLPAEHLYKGQTAIGASTEIADARSGVTRIVVNSETGDAASRFPARPPAESMALVCVMARTKNHVFVAGDEAKFRKMVGHMTPYFSDISRGKVAVADAVWVTGDGKGIEIPTYEIDGDSGTYFDGVLGNAEVKKVMPKSGPVTVVVFAPAKAAKSGTAGWSMPWVSVEARSDVPDLPVDQRGSFINITSHTPGTLAHEIAHGLGAFRAQNPSYVQLPDLYNIHWLYWFVGKTESNYYGVSSYSNLTETTGNYFLMGGGNVRNARVAGLEGYSQHWLGWVDFYPTASSSTATLKVPNLSKGDLSLERVPTLTVPDDGREAYVVLEGRSLDDEYFTDGKDDTNWPGDGVVVYKIRERTEAEKEELPDDLKHRMYWPGGIDYLRTLNDRDPYYIDLGDGYRLDLVDERFNPSAAAVQVKTRPLTDLEYAVGYAAPGLRYMGAVAGMVSVLPMMTLPKIALAPEENQPIAVFPDLDLHAYLPDGTHIGMNYETGEYENPTEALTSGDRSMDDEWILVPSELESGTRYEISSADAKRYADESKTEPLELAYSITPTVFDEAQTAVAKGPSRSGTIKAGDTASVEIRSEDDTLSVEPVDRGRDESGPASTLMDKTVLLLGGSGVLFVGALAALFVPRRRVR